MYYFTEKNGITTDEVTNLYKHIIDKCEHIEVIGLMTIGQYGYDCSQGPNPDFLVFIFHIKTYIQKYLHIFFKTFQSLIDCKKTVCENLKLIPSEVELSMGMSDDFEHAVSLLFMSILNFY